MRKVFLLLVATIFVFSCAEDIQDYSPAIQGFVNNELYRATGVNATRKLDGAFLIEGLTQLEALKINITAGTPGVYNLGGASLNTATFSDKNGNSYFTNPNGEGQVVVTELNVEESYISGNFNYKAIQTGLDSIVVKNGVFFQVPFAQEIEPIIVDPTLPAGPCNAGTFVANVDGEPISTSANLCVMAVIFQNQIVVTATDADEEIQVRLPINVLEGSVSLPEDNFLASYTDLATGETREAQTGAIFISIHNQTSNLIRANFTFNTGIEEITIGNFDVTYQ
ncbi:hypothetical protein ULMS_00580 [Patiriisocius marinistellae]|uniref:DUF5689 domain-containing protein n=1 Tax=Patiriisocius marinistellae TaxID=2494560 RepID=A0A5J4FSX7_9FLAO|nr:DUF6252 family protein [Patiriisocius marinistellae]GEQ84550.1 hypothetical protein ULMS_00580 [Patiriisocius marinistellae]